MTNPMYWQEWQRYDTRPSVSTLSVFITYIYVCNENNIDVFHFLSSSYEIWCDIFTLQLEEVLLPSFVRPFFLNIKLNSWRNLTKLLSFSPVQPLYDKRWRRSHDNIMPCSHFWYIFCLKKDTLLILDIL